MSLQQVEKILKRAKDLGLQEEPQIERLSSEYKIMRDMIEQIDL